nr:PAS domain S-box protein [Aromatoleum toluclasticum]
MDREQIGRASGTRRNNVLLKIVLVATLYVLGGLAGRLLALPPGYASLVWPAAGLAVAALLIGGVRCWPGVWLGAFMLNIWLDLSATGAFVAALNASAATMQALFGFWFARRFLDGASPLARNADLWRFLFRAGPFACLVSATIGVATLNGFGRLADAGALNQWLIWWAGDVVGVLLFMPMALVAWPGGPPTWARNRISIVLPLLTTAALVAAGGFGLTRLEQARAQRAAEHLQDQAYELGFLALPSAIDSLLSVERFFAANEAVTQRQFSLFTSYLLERPGLQAIAWLPRIEAADRAVFEATLRDDFENASGITERAPDGRLIGADTRSAYFPGRFVEPLAHSRTLVGYDFAAHPARLAAMDRARDTGQAVATAPLPLVQNGQIGVPVFVPVYQLTPDDGAKSVEQRRAALKGVLMGSFDLEQLFAPLANVARARELAFRVSDITPGALASVLVTTLPAGAAPQWHRDVQFAGRVWRLEMQHASGLWLPGESVEARAYLAFSVLAAFLITLVTLGMVGRNAAVEAQVAQRTAALEEELRGRRSAEAALQQSEKDLDITLHSIGDAVLATDADGRVTRLNPIAEQLTGWSLSAARGRSVQEVFRIINEQTRLPARIPVDDVLRTGAIQGLANHTVLISRDGRECAVEDSAAPIVDADGIVRGVVLVFRDVTEARRAELALAASEARYRQFIELSPFGVFVQSEGCFQFLNPKAIALFGAESADQLIGRRVLDFVHPDSRVIAGERIGRLNNERAVATALEEKLLRTDGSAFLGEVTAVPYDHDGRTGGLVLFQDVTARREATEQLDRIFNLSLDLMCIIDMEGYFQRINPAASQLLGWSEAEILARPFMDLLHPDDLPATMAQMERIAANEPVLNFENRYRCKNGSWCWLAWKALPQPGGLIFATARDATEQHEAAQRLSQLNRELERRVDERTVALEALNAKKEEIRAVVDNLLECVIRIDNRGIVRSANPAVERILGYRSEEVIGQNVSTLMPEPHRSRHDEYLDRYRRTGEAHIIGIGREVEGRHKDGHLIPLSLSVVEYAMRGERFFIGTLRDIGENKRLIAELTTARADAEQASRAKSAFLATISHEIRTPMNGVVGMVDVLANGRLSEHQMDLIRTIRESATTLLGLIDDILDFSKIEAGKLEIERAPLSISDLVEGLCNSLVPVAARRGVDVSLFISPDIPERVLADDVRLRQVLYNLVGNAIKFSAGRPDQHGRVSVRVEIVEEAPLRLAIRIADNGIGMAPDTLGSLFTPFSQAEVSTTRRFGGTGLGLAICKRLVDLMNGEILVESVPGEGAIFTVTLPFEIASEQPVRVLPDLRDVNCILIQSADLNISDLSTYLEHAGARTRVAVDEGGAAAEAATLAAPVVVISYSDHRCSQTCNLAAAIPKVHCLQITRGRRRRARAVAPDMVTLDGDALRRQALLHAVAVAAGRASPEIVHHNGNGPFDDEEVPPPSVAEARALGRLVLVAEDDDINQKVILQQLALLGYAAEVASTGAEALQMWRIGHYALLLTDLHMPELDGYELAETIRREEAGRRRIPILALTANALRGEASRARALGMDEYLTKPIQLHVLRAALEKWLPTTKASPPPAAPHPAEQLTPLVNVAVLKELVGDDPETVDAILGDYLVSAKQHASDLHAAITDGDMRTVGAIAHKLKSSSRAVGAAGLGDLCAELENAVRSEDRTAIAQRIAQFDDLVGAVLVAVLIEKNRS